MADDAVPLPFAWGVAYRHPDVDGSRKACRNCFMWVSGEDRCLIHARDLEVLDRYICAFHVEGAPVQKWMDHPGGLTPLDPKTSGLRVVGGGASCDTCIFFRKIDTDNGSCVAVADASTKEPPQKVEAKGWCSRHQFM